MDPTLIQALAALILGSGGLVGALNWKRAKRSRIRGVPGDERQARSLADDSSLNKYWQQEITQFRKERAKELEELRAEIVSLRHLRHLDEMYIDKLEEHIWLQRPPPPPSRRASQ